MAVVTRTNLMINPSFELNLDTWTASGSTTITRVDGINGSHRMRITAGSTTVNSVRAFCNTDVLTAGVQYRAWAYVPASSGMSMQVIGELGSGATFTTNDPVNQQGALTFTAIGGITSILIQNTATTTVGDWCEVEYVIVEEVQTGITTYAYFDGDTPGARWVGQPGLSRSVFDRYNPDAPAMPIVEFDANPVTDYEFVLDRDSLDDTDVSLGKDHRWWRVDADKVEIRRGRQDENSEMSVGTATITLDDYEGIYDPDNPATPLQLGGVPVMRAGMDIRVTALMVFMGEIHQVPLFYGSLDDLAFDRAWSPTVTVTAVDDMGKLNGSDVPPYEPAIGYGQTTAQRAAWALSVAGIPLENVSLPVDDMTRLMLATPGGGNVGSHLREAANCEGGKVFVQADGTIHIGTHRDDFVTTPAATFTDDGTTDAEIEYDTIETSTSIKQMINRVEIVRGSYTAPEEVPGDEAPATNLAAAPSVFYQDEESVALNNRVWSEQYEAPVLDDADALILAQWRATRKSRSATRVDSISASVLSHPVDGQFAMISVDIADVVRIRRYAYGRGIDGTYSVEGVDHTIAEGDWHMTVYTSPLDITSLYADQPRPFILDTSSLDGADVLAAF